MDASAPHVWIVAGQVGAISEPWLWRQVTGLQRVRPTILTSEIHNPEQYPVDGISVLVSSAVRLGDQDGRRWLRRLIRMPDRNFYSPHGRDQRFLLRTAELDPPGAILCHFGYMSLRFLPVAQRLGIPLVAHFHGLDLSSGLNNRWYHWSLRRWIGDFAATIVVGNHQASLLESWEVPRDKVHVIPCGVPVDEFQPAETPKPGPLRIVAVTRLVPQKGVDLSIQAFSCVRRLVPGVRFDVVGDGPERPSLEALARDLGIENDVVFHGPLAQSDVRQVLMSADVFLQHSIRRSGWVEGFGVSVTEAAASGLPVVVSDCGGLTDQVLDHVNGIVVPEGDVSATARALVELLTDADKRRTYGAAGRRQASEKFDTPQQIVRLEDVLLEAISDRASQ